MAEVYAGMSEYADAQVGRIVDYLEESGQLENTLVFYCADNGASGEGSPNGSVNEGKFLNAWPDTIEENLPLHRQARRPGRLQPLSDRLGGCVLDAVPDVQALHLPGRCLRPARDLLAAGMKARGEVREPVPPLDRHRPDDPRVLRDRAPKTMNGVEQSPLAGVSMRYSFDAADAPTQKETQYYEMFGMRGLWHKGWKAVTEHGPISGMSNFENDTWQLFHTEPTVPRHTTWRASTRRRSRSSSSSGSRRQGQQRPAAERHDGGREGPREVLQMEFHVPVPPSGQYTYYPGTTEVPERSAANVARRLVQGARRGRVHEPTRRA